MGQQTVLFLCTGNSARSQMAEAFLRQLGGERYLVHSAGVEPAPGVHPLAIAVMEELGYDMSGHRSKDVGQFIGAIDFAYIITLCDHARATCPFFPGGGQRLHWGFEDPAAFVGSEEERLAKFREVRDAIRQRIEEWLADEGGDQVHETVVLPPDFRSRLSTHSVKAPKKGGDR